MENEDSSAVVVYEWFIIKERSIFITLNKLKTGDRLFFGLYWIPNTKLKIVNDEISSMTYRLKASPVAQIPSSPVIASNQRQ